MSDPRAPAIAGAGQLSERAGDDGPSPLDLMVGAARAAAADAGPGGDALLRRVRGVAVVDCFSWPVPDPGAALAARLGLEPHETVRSARGGTGPLELLADLCARIQAGELDVALLAGGEAVNPFMRAMRDGRPTGWPDPPGTGGPDRVVGTDRPAGHPAEEAAGLIAPIFFYPLIESAVRGAAGRDREEHRRRLAALWDRFAAVAAGNPHAWTRDPPRGEALARPSESNRMVAEPYTKLLTANIQVDQGAALLLCSAAAAAAAGVSPDRLVHVHAAATAHDHWFVSERQELHRSPAVAACGRTALQHADAGIDDIAHLDLYSCFPSAVQVAATIAVLSARPPRRRFRHHDVQAQVDALPRRRVVAAAAGAAQVEAFTTIHDREGAPTLAIVTCLLQDGSRAPAKCQDRATIDRLLDGEPLGRPVQLAGAGGFVDARA